MGRLDGKVVLITGAARGVGEAEAELFTAEGAQAVLGDVRDELGKAVAAELDGAEYVHLDVSQPDDWQAAVAVAKERFGRLDTLVNTAGIARYARFEDCTLDEYMAHFNTNQLGTWLGIKTCIDPLREAGGGSIVNIASVAGFRGCYGAGAYCSSKFAVRGLTQCAAIELGPLGIRVNAICPGGIDTPMAKEALRDWFGVDVGAQEAAPPTATGWQLPLRRMASPGEIAAAALFLASDESSYCTGSDFVVDGGLSCDHPFPPGGPKIPEPAANGR